VENGVNPTRDRRPTDAWRRNGWMSGARWCCHATRVKRVFETSTIIDGLIAHGSSHLRPVLKTMQLRRSSKPNLSQLACARYEKCFNNLTA
jgi:hypothetical protein